MNRPVLETFAGWSTRSGDCLRGLTGWRRLLAAFVAGAASALGFAPFNLFPLLLAGFAVAVLLIDGAKPEYRVIWGGAVTWAFAFGQYTVGMHWIAFAFLVDPAAHAWQIPVVFIFFAILALFQFCAGLVAACFWRHRSIRIFGFALAYGLSEWLRGHLFTGFPWNLPAYGWGASLAVLQSAAVFGAYGLSFLTVLFGAALADLFSSQPKWRLPAFFAALFALLWLSGLARLAAVKVPEIAGVELRLVQPNIPQAEKYQRRYVARNWRRLVELSLEPGHPTLILWPEAAPPFLLDEQPVALEQIAQLSAGGQGLLTGGVRRYFQSPDDVRFANSLFIFARKGALVGVYDKSHLVPFGEYLPYEQTLNRLGFAKLTGIDGSFKPGDGPRIFAVPGAGNVTGLICYEILFPGKVAPVKRPDWFANVTDDSWFGPWAGPRQHLLVARVRAIEEGVPVVRAANTGISAIIDPLGRITAKLGLDKIGVVDGRLPAAIAPTPYSRWPDGFFWALVCANVALTWILFKGKW